MVKKAIHTQTLAGVFYFLRMAFRLRHAFTLPDKRLGLLASLAKAFLHLCATAIVISGMCGNLKLVLFIQVWPAQATTTAKRLQ